MPNIKSAKKRVKVTVRRTLRNKMLRSRLKTILRKAFENVSNEDFKLLAIKELDRAVSKGILHKNNAARKKSQLSA